MMVKVSVDQQAWLSKMKMVAMQNVAASQEAELNEDEDILNLKVNKLASNRHFCYNTRKSNRAIRVQVWCFNVSATLPLP